MFLTTPSRPASAPPPQFERLSTFLEEVEFLRALFTRASRRRFVLAVTSLLEAQSLLTDTLWVNELMTKWAPYNRIGAVRAPGAASVYTNAYTLAPDGNLAWCAGCAPFSPYLGRVSFQCAAACFAQGAVLPRR